MDKLEQYRQHLDELKSSTDCAELAADLGIIQKGRRWYCPSCQQGSGKSPDMQTSARGWHCFKCEAKGDALALIEITRSCDHAAAVSYLEEFTGIRRPERRNKATESPQSAFQLSSSIKSPPSKPPAQDQSERIAIITAFIQKCSPLSGDALQYMERTRCIPRSILERANIRFCGSDYVEIVDDLGSTFGKEPVKAAGLWSFYGYFKAQVGFLLLPYQSGGLIVYLKARPPLSKQQCEDLGVERFLFMRGSVPCFYAQGQLQLHSERDRLLICEGEIDCLSAIAMGEAAVGIPGWAGFKTEWVRQLKPWDGRVLLVLDGDPAGQQGVQDICSKFLDAGLQAPLVKELPAGKDLNDLLVEQCRSKK